MKPYDVLEAETTVEIIAFDSEKPDMVVWRCTEEQGNDWGEIQSRVKAQGYRAFEKKTTTTNYEFYDIED